MILEDKINQSETRIFKAVSGTFTFVAIDKDKNPLKITV